MGLRGASNLSAARGAVARLGVLPEQPREVRQERHLLAHERPVDAVLASDLGEQAAQFGGAGEEALLLGRGGEPEAGYRPPGASGSAPGAPPVHRALDLQA